MGKVLVGNLEAKGPLGRLRLRWEERMILKEIGCPPPTPRGGA